MAFIEKKVKTFDKGIIDELGADKIPAGAASESTNFIDLGDRTELVRGYLALGTIATGLSKIGGLYVGEDILGNEVIYRKEPTKITRYNSATETWVNSKTGLPDEDMKFTRYRSPAGSFVFASSPTSGLYRVNLANPDSWVDLYDAAKNFKGYITAEDNRLFLWNTTSSPNALNLSYIDADVYTAINNENIGTGSPPTTTFTGTLANTLIAGFTISADDTVETFTDNGNGTLTGSLGGTGTINYTTGAYSITFNTAPTGGQAIRIDYEYETPNTTGVTDFTYSATRLAGQGSFLPQFQGNDIIQTVLPYDEKFYSFQRNQTWVVDIEADDSDASNKIYRIGLGIPNHRAAIATQDGIYLVDDTDDENKAIRLMQLNDLSSRVKPESISGSVNLDSADFQDAAMVEYGDYIITAYRSSSDVSYNDTLALYNKKWKVISKMDGLFRDFAVYDRKLYGASSTSENVHQIFSGFDDNGIPLTGEWVSNNWDMESEELKKCKKFVAEGHMDGTQELIVDISYDNGDFVELGRIAGTSQYVSQTETFEYGRDFYGSSEYGGSEDEGVAYYYMREFHLRSDKFFRARVKFRTESIGYLSVRMYNWKDIRETGHRVLDLHRSPNTL